VGADRESLTVALDHPAADAGIVAFEGLGEIGEAEIERRETLDVGDDHILLGIAADRIDAGNAGNSAEERRDDPVLRSAKIGGLVGLGDQPFPFGGDIASVGLKSGFARLVNIVLAMRE